MRKTSLKLTATMFVAFTVVPNCAQANETVDNWLDSLYVSAFLGAHFLPDIVKDTSYTTVSNSHVETYEQETGFSARFAVGGYVNSYLRTELELGFGLAIKTTPSWKSSMECFRDPFMTLVDRSIS